MHDGHMTTTRHTHPALTVENTPTVENILRVYRSATAAQVAEGIRWYATAHTVALALDPSNVRRAAGIIAALSPRLDWDKNVELAARVYTDGFASGCLRSNGAKAERIFAGESPEDVLGGNKVRAFYGTIVDPTDHYAVVIDRHAFDVATGRVADDATRAILSRKGVYDTFANAYREAASIAGISPAQLQSITWIAWRESHAIFAASNRSKRAA